MRCWPLILFALSKAAVAAPCHDRLRIGFLDTPLAGFLNGQGTQFAAPQAGSLVDDTRRTLEALGCKAELKRMPARRLASALQDGSIDIIVPRAAQPDLLQAFAFPLDAQGRADTRLSLGEARTALFARVDRGWSEAPALPGRRIGVMRGSLAEQWLKARQLIAQEVPDVPRGLEMLRRGHVELLAMPHVLASADELAREPAIRELHPPLAELSYFAPAHRGFAERHPAFLQAFWLGMCKRSRSQFPKLPPCPP